MVQAKRNFYGGAVLGRKKAPLVDVVDVAAISLVGSAVVFALTCVLYTFGLFYHTNVVFFLTLLGYLICILLVRNGRKNAGDLEELDSQGLSWRALQEPLGTSCAVAICLGVVIGIECYRYFGYYRFLYLNSRRYYNLVPSSMPAAAVADGARLWFDKEAYVDQSQSVGFAAEDGHRYCIAPIRDGQSGHRIEYWAAGRDCCGWKQSFFCDDMGAPDAHGGVVMYETTNREYYDRSRMKAEASFGLASPETPTYVRWVTEKKLDDVPKSYNQHAWFSIGMATLVYAMIYGIYLRCMRLKR